MCSLWGYNSRRHLLRVDFNTIEQPKVGRRFNAKKMDMQKCTTKNGPSALFGLARDDRKRIRWAK